MIVILLIALIASAAGQQNIQDPISNFCRRHKHQTCVVDSKLYIDGGLVHYGSSVLPDDVPERNTWLLWEDLSDLKPGLPPQYKNLTKSSQVPTVSGGVLWPDQVNKNFYLFGGAYNGPRVPDFNDLWSYDTIYNNWTKVTPDGTQLGISWPSLGASDVTDEGIAYYYGGYLGNDSAAGWTGETMMQNSLVKYDMNTNKWDSRVHEDRTPRAEGNLHYIPASNRGMLVHFGGLEQKTVGNTSYASMSDIHVFDIANSRWFTQTATGDVPQARRGFCSGVVWAQDYSSYNFYVYGGISSNETALGDLHILSLPSFEWISWWPNPQLTYFPGGKAWSSCNVIQDSQMIIMGGQYINPDRQDCDAANAQGQHSLLLGQESIDVLNLWHNLDRNVTKYRVPGNITAVIGGGTEGKATVTAPANGWQNSGLGVYFGTNYRAAPRSATRSIPSPSSTNSSASQPASETNTRAIAGGVVGGVVALLGIIGLAWFYLHRCRQRKQPVTFVSRFQCPNQGTAEKLRTSPQISYPGSLPSPFTPNSQKPSPNAWNHEDISMQYAGSQPYYAPHADQPTQSANVELPPNEILEMPGSRVPAPKRINLEV